MEAPVILCHASYATFDLFRQMFDGRLIRRKDDNNWPPRNCDLTPFDYFLHDAVKEKGYADRYN